jgi:hypothetical protein
VALSRGPLVMANAAPAMEGVMIECASASHSAHTGSSDVEEQRGGPEGLVLFRLDGPPRPLNRSHRVTIGAIKEKP